MLNDSRMIKPVYHAFGNCAGGAATAGIYPNEHFDNYLRELAEGGSHMKHQSFTLEGPAWNFVRRHVPVIRCPASMKWYNENVPAESSNLGGPNPIIRNLVGPHKTRSPRLKEVFYFQACPPEIQAKRLATSERMRQQGLSIDDSWDFLPREHQRWLAETGMDPAAVTPQ